MFNWNMPCGGYANAGSNKNECASDNDFETLQNARKDLIGELDAIVQYDNHLHKTDNNLAKETWKDIRDEELVHVGELLGLLCSIAPYQRELIQQGLNEFAERVKKNA